MLVLALGLLISAPYVVLVSTTSSLDIGEFMVYALTKAFNDAYILYGV